MKKKIFTLLLALMMLVFSLTAFAAVPNFEQLPDSVLVPAKMQVRLSGTDETWASSKNELKMTAANMTAKTVDFKVTLTTNPIKGAITEWYEYAKNFINTNFTGTFKDEMLANFSEWTVTGSFTVKIKFPAQFSGEELDNHLNGSNMYGFNDEAKTLFKETSRTVTEEGEYKTLTITLVIADGDEEGIVEQKLYDDVKEGGTGAYLNELTYTVEDVTTGTFSGSLTVEGNMTGSTSFQVGTDDSDDEAVSFYTNDKVSGTVRKKTTTGSGSVESDYKVTFNIDGDTDFVDPMYAKGKVSADKLPAPQKPGYTFDGWYTDSSLKNKVGDSINVTKNMTLYGHWVSNTLVTEEHYAYILGYPDETVRPGNNITREEAATMFYRLLRDEVREKYYTTENDFSDIAKERWSNSAISTMANGGFVVGRTDGTFDPEAPITRAEFAAMAVRFASLMDTSGASFSDIEGHWAERYILKAATAGWVSGRTDGTFDPEAYITRAEAMTLVNNVLMRHVNKEGLHANTRIWVDMNGDEWFYYIVLEATNSHDYTRQEDGYNETWTEILPNKEWK